MQHRVEGGGPGGTLRALVEMLSEPNPLVLSRTPRLPRHEGLKQVVRRMCPGHARLAMDWVRATCLASYATRSLRRARKIRFITVPIGIASRSAISWYLRCWK